jgi:hypothetical protein
MRYMASTPVLPLRELVVFCNEMIKILLFEQQRWMKYRMAVRGILDFLRGELGAYKVTRKPPSGNR